MVLINNLFDAIKYWRSKKGGKVYAGDELINSIKRPFYKILAEDIIPGIREKIKNARRNKTYHIRNAPGSRRACWCSTLGSFSVNIEYDYYFESNWTKHSINFHFFGYDRWDFEKMEANWYEIDKHLHNLYEEFCQSLAAGDGKPYDIYYDFNLQYDFDENPFWDNLANALKGD